MRRLAVIALALGVIVAGCGDGPDSASVDCGVFLTWDGKEYEGIADVRVERGESLGRGENPCREADQAFDVVAVSGVASELAVTEATGRYVFARRGVLTVLAGFPIRFPAPAPQPARCDKPVDDDIELTFETYGGHSATGRTGRRRYSLRFGRGSRVRTERTIGGQPLLQAGDRVHVSGRACNRGGRYWHTQVTALRPAG